MANNNKLEEITDRLENGKDVHITYNDLVRLHIPNAKDKECEYILWEHTLFPMGSPKDINRQLFEYVEHLNGRDKYECN